MSIVFNGDPEVLRGTANHTAACLGELESHLKALMGVQDELYAAVVSRGTGSAIYRTLGEAHHSGTVLAGTLQQIVDELSQTGVSVDAQDLEGAGRVNALLGDDGEVDAGTWVPTSDQLPEPVDTKSW